MSGQNVNTRIECTERWFARDFGEPTIIRHKIDHFFFHILAKIFHIIRTLGQTGRNEHMIAYFGRIIFVFERQTPIFRIFIIGRLGRNVRFGPGGQRSSAHDDGGGGRRAGDGLPEVRAGDDGGGGVLEGKITTAYITDETMLP
jgi:hypothetical protein